ncbi:MAG: hypothetical protein MN733_15705 [Nitrososphaera sp.]|nr:hypothetical protein [Nitrososphaera sp.]
MSGFSLKLKDFAKLSEAEKKEQLQNLMEEAKGEGLTRSLERLRKELDRLEFEYKMTTEDMIGSRACYEIEQDPTLNKWATYYACYKQLLSTSRNDPAQQPA